MRQDYYQQQQPGFFCRHRGKIITLTILVVLIVLALMILCPSRSPNVSFNGAPQLMSPFSPDSSVMYVRSP